MLSAGSRMFPVHWISENYLWDDEELVIVNFLIDVTKECVENSTSPVHHEYRQSSPAKDYSGPAG